MNNQSWFELYLDTSPPKVEIYSPKYTSPDIFTDIVIESNKPLMDCNEVYIIDSLGIKHNYIFNFDNNKLVGKVILNDVSLGNATIFCRVKDCVWNISNLYSMPINIINGENFSIDIKEFDTIVNIDDFSRQLDINIIHDQVSISIEV